MASMILVFLLAFAHQELIDASTRNSCADVRRAFVTQKIGPLKIVPFQPLSADVSFLTAKAKAVSSRTLKPLLVGRHTRGRSTRIDEAVDKLYANIDLNTSETDLQSAFKWFEDSMFNVMYASLSRPDDVTMRSLYEECTANQRRVINPFENIPSEAYRNISSALRLALQFKEVLEVGKMAVNLTESYQLSKNCQAGLTRMVFCSHCYGLTLIRPCADMCHNVIRGCLAGLTEVGLHWTYYVQHLTAMSEVMRSTDPSKNLDIAFMEFNRQFGTIVNNLKSQKSSIRKQVSKECKRYLEKSRSKRSSSKRSRMPSPDDILDASSSSNNGNPAAPSSHQVPFLQHESVRKTRQQVKNRRTASRSPERSRKHVRPPHEMLKIARIDKSHRQQNTEAIESLMDRLENKPETNLHTRLERFTTLFNDTWSLYRDLPDSLCDSTHESSIGVINDDICWDGGDIVDKYKRNVVEVGFQHQKLNPEVRVKYINDQTIEVIYQLRTKTQEMIRILGISEIPSILQKEMEYSKKTKESNKKSKSLKICDDEDDCDDTGSGYVVTTEQIKSTEYLTAEPKTNSYPITNTKYKSKDNKEITKEGEESVKKKHRNNSTLSLTTPKNNFTSAPKRRHKSETTTGGSASTVFNKSIYLQYLIAFYVLYYFNIDNFLHT